MESNTEDTNEEDSLQLEIEEKTNKSENIAKSDKSNEKVVKFECEEVEEDDNIVSLGSYEPEGESLVNNKNISKAPSSPARSSSTGTRFTDPTQTLVHPDKKTLNSWIILWYLIAKGGEQLWNFAVPLALIDTFPESLMPVAVYCAFTKLICLLFASNLGAWLDSQSRSKVLSVSFAFQFVSLPISALFLIILIYRIQAASDEAIGFYSMSSGLSFLCFIIASVLGSLGTLTLTSSVENDWIPVITPVIDLISLREKMSKVALLCDILAPLISAAIFGSIGLLPGFFAISLVSFLLLLPQYICLRMVISSRPQLYDPSNKTEVQDAMRNPFAVIYQDAGILRQHIASGVIISDMLLNLTVLNPSNMVLLAFLWWWRLPLIMIGAFRGFSSVMASIVTGGALYHVFLRRIGLFKTCILYSIIYGIFLLISVILFNYPTDTGKFCFVVFLGLARVGHFGWKMGKIQLMETISQGTEERRKKLTLLDNAFGNVATLIVFSLITFVGDPNSFIIFVFGSLITSFIGIIIFWRWSANPSNRNAVTLNGSNLI